LDGGNTPGPSLLVHELVVSLFHLRGEGGREGESVGPKAGGRKRRREGGREGTYLFEGVTRFFYLQAFIRVNERRKLAIAKLNVILRGI